MALRDGERHGAGVVLDQHGLAEPPLQAGGEREVAGPEHRAPGDDPVAGVHIALAGKPYGLHVAGPIVLRRRTRSFPASTSISASASEGAQRMLDVAAGAVAPGAVDETQFDAVIAGPDTHHSAEVGSESKARLSAAPASARRLIARLVADENALVEEAGGEFRHARRDSSGDAGRFRPAPADLRGRTQSSRRRRAVSRGESAIVLMKLFIRVAKKTIMENATLRPND